MTMLCESHLFQSLDNALSRFPNARIIIMGDFNQFRPGILKQVVDKPTRDKNKLDEVFTSMAKVFLHELG